MDGFEKSQDVIGQLPALKAYLHYTAGFASPSDVSKQEVAEKFQAAARKVVASFPFLAGKVINEGSGEGNSGLFRVAPCPEFDGTFVRKVKNCEELCPSYDEIMAARGAFRTLDGFVLTEQTAFPLSYQEDKAHPAPVVAAQINFVKDGILINWCSQHNIMDAGGLSQVWKLVATALRGEEFPEVALVEGNRDRRDIIPLLRPDEPLKDHSHLRKPANPPPMPPLSSFEWRDYRITGAGIKAIKALASNAEEFDPSVRFISSNDAISAFCWQQVARARVNKLNKPADAVGKIGRSLDIHGILKIPQEYMGHSIFISKSWLPLGEIANRSLSYVASVLRKSLSEVANEYCVRSFATLIANTPDKSTITFAGRFDPETDFGLSSVTSLPWRFEYGVLGTPDFCKRPLFGGLPSTVYLMPQYADGGIDVQYCLKPEELAAIEQDLDWQRFAERL